MPIARAEVSNYASGQLPADWVVNTVYHDIAETIVGFDIGGPGWGNHADELLAAFNGTDGAHGDFDVLATRHIEVKVYNMADAEPRPVMAHAVYNPVGGGGDVSAFGPPQVGLCLSYYPQRNIAGSRGRLYLGPWRKTDMSGRPSGSVLLEALGLGDALFNIGGENVHWVLHHQGIQTSARGVHPAVYGTTQSGHPAGSTEVIHHYWVDDSWDIIRGRKLKATTRQVSNH